MLKNDKLYNCKRKYIYLIHNHKFLNSQVQYNIERLLQTNYLVYAL